MIWTEEQKAVVRKMWLEEGASASRIANVVGCTRNAAIGVVHRMGLTGKRTKPAGAVKAAARREGRLARRSLAPRRSPSDPVLSHHHAHITSFVGGFVTEAEREAHAQEGLVARTANVFSPAGAPQNARIVALEELEAGQCKWPLFDEKPFLFCGADAPLDADGKQPPYCRFHARRARSGVQ